jgi:hypothetical protein
MTARLLQFIIGTFFLTGCLYTKVPDFVTLTPIEDLKTEKGQESCLETNQEEFFGKMINQRLSKVAASNWDIFFKDTVSIYYGHTLLTKKGLYADQTFKIKKSLIKEFPKFEELKFYKIKELILGYAYTDNFFGEHFKIEEAKDSFRLTRDIIFVDTKRRYKTWKSNQLKKKEEEVHFKIAVDAKTLELLTIAQFGKD